MNDYELIYDEKSNTLHLSIEETIKWAKDTFGNGMYAFEPSEKNVYLAKELYRITKLLCDLNNFSIDKNTTVKTSGEFLSTIYPQLYDRKNTVGKYVKKLQAIELGLHHKSDISCTKEEE
jgi:hypothetical protein